MDTRAEEHHLGAGAGAVAVEVDDELVHADPAAHRAPAARDQHLGARCSAWRGTPSPYPTGTRPSVVGSPACQVWP